MRLLERALREVRRAPRRARYAAARMRRAHVLSAAAATVSAAALGLLAAAAPGNTSHDGWPRIDGVLLMNKTDSRRPLDARPGHDPFGRRDRRYSFHAIPTRGQPRRPLLLRRDPQARQVPPALHPRPRAARARHDLPPRPQRAPRRPR